MLSLCAQKAVCIQYGISVKSVHLKFVNEGTLWCPCVPKRQYTISIRSV